MKKIFTLFCATMFSCLLLAQNATDTLYDRGYVVKTGDYAPDITIEYINGRKTKLSELKGHIVLLQFTASWCSVCRQEMPHLEKEIWQVYKNKGLIFTGIDLKEPVEKVKQFQKSMKITYPLSLDTSGEKFYSFAVEGAGVTRNILIDKNGKIVYLTRLYNPEEFNGLKEKLAEIFAATE